MSSDAADDLDDRIAVALPPIGEDGRARAADQGWAIDLLDALDPDDRAMLISLAHPELDEAISDGAEQVLVSGSPVNPRLHLTIHEIVAAQLINGDPPEALQTAQRLIALGRDPHEVLHMLGYAMSPQLWSALRDERPYNHAEHVAALRALPGSWDREAARGRQRPQRRARSQRRRRHR